jgi:hypothetical protein
VRFLKLAGQTRCTSTFNVVLRCPLHSAKLLLFHEQSTFSNGEVIVHTVPRRSTAPTEQAVK